jgi:hypothetical protein
VGGDLAAMRRAKSPPTVADEAEAYLRDTRRRPSHLERSVAFAGAVTLVGVTLAAGTTAVRHLPSARVVVESREGGGLHIGLGSTTTTAPTSATPDRSPVIRRPAIGADGHRTPSTIATFTDVMPEEPADAPEDVGDAADAKRDAQRRTRERSTTSVRSTEDRDDKGDGSRDSDDERDDDERDDDERDDDERDDDQEHEGDPSTTTTSTSTTSTTVTTTPSKSGTTTTSAPPSGRDGRDH